jgi:hypothetical protein
MALKLGSGFCLRERFSFLIHLIHRVRIVLQQSEGGISLKTSFDDTHNTRVDDDGDLKLLFLLLLILVQERFDRDDPSKAKKRKIKFHNQTDELPTERGDAAGQDVGITHKTKK